jgi:ribose transport system substrate-binding protein
LLWFGTGRIFGIPVSVYVFLLITIGGWVLLNRTRYGRYVVAVGGNREAARIAGVPVRKIIFSVYVLSGLLAGVAAVLLCARLGSASPAATATVLGDNYQIGVLAADYIAGQLKCQGNIVEIQGLAGISVTTDRSKGFKDELKAKCPGVGVKIVASQPGDFNPDTGLKVMENILQAQKKIDAVYTHDDDMAQGVVQAIRNAGRDKEMFLTGVGGSEDAMKQIQEGGLYRATFLYNPNMAATAVNMARLIALGQGFSELVPSEVPRQMVVPAAVVTKDNVDKYEKYAFN